MESNINQLYGLWWFSLGLLTVTTWMTSKVLKRRVLNAKTLIRDQRGTVHIPLVALLALIIFSIALVIETTNLIVAGIGVRTACAATTRSATVWLAIDQIGEKHNDVPTYGVFSRKRHQLNRIKDAATHNLAAFSTGLIEESKLPSKPFLRDQDPEGYVENFQRTHHGKASTQFLTRQYLYADSAKVTINVAEPCDPYDQGTHYPGQYFPATLRYRGGKASKDDFCSDVTVTIEHYVPFQLPLIGRFLGEKPWPGADFYAMKITASYTLPKEGYQGPKQKPGIHVFRK